MRVLQIDHETTMFTSVIPIPGLGALPINAYLIRGAEPVLVDTSIVPEREAFLEAVGSLIDPADIRWIWLTHADRDHTGSVAPLLELAPNARFIVTMTTLGLMSLGLEAIPPERALLVRDGSAVDVGDRTLVAVRPPLFDNPGTAGFVDASTGRVVSSDCFGAVLPTAEDALAEDVGEVTEDALTVGQMLWGSADAPWVHLTDEGKYAESLASFARHDPSLVLSSHLPPIKGSLDRHIKTLTMLRTADAFVSPDQAELEAVLASLEP